MLARDPGGWYDELLNQIEGESKDSEERASLVSTGANSDDLEAMSHKKKAVQLDLLSRKLIPISIAIVNLGSFIYLVWL